MKWVVLLVGLGCIVLGIVVLRWTYQDSKGFDPDDLVAKSYGTYQGYAAGVGLIALGVLLFLDKLF